MVDFCSLELNSVTWNVHQPEIGHIHLSCTLISDVSSSATLCILKLPVTQLSAFTSTLFCPEGDGGLVGITKSLCSTCTADVTVGEGAVSPMETGDMIGALTGRAVLFKVGTMAEWRKLGGGTEKTIRCVKPFFFFSS